jgi:dihydroorotate dehydrogenase (fumarate)
MDLSTTYLGFSLPHPFIAGASPLSESVDGARKLEDAGAAAIVLPSLFEEQIDQESLATIQSMEGHAHSHGEALSYFADLQESAIGPDSYLSQLRKIKEHVKVPVIASLNGYTQGGWLKHAALMQEAGADALEMNLYMVATDASESAADLEAREIEMVKEVKKLLDIPLAIKVSPFYTSLAHFATHLEGAGADGLVIFNRFFESDIDIEELEIKSRLQLSTSNELLLRLRWLAILAGTLKSTQLAVTGGVHSAVGAIKAVMSGASAIQVVSTLYHDGVDRLSQIQGEMAAWMVEKEYDSLEQMKGSMSILTAPDPLVLSRANYMHQLRTWEASRY